MKVKGELNVTKDDEKIFTKKQKNIIMNEKYNPLKVNYKLICKREGLFMEKREDIVLDEITKELNFREKIVFRILKKDFIKVYKEGVKKGFNWSNSVR